MPEVQAPPLRSQTPASDGASARPSGPEVEAYTDQIVRHCSAYRDAKISHALFQLANTVAPYAVLFGLMLYLAVNGHTLFAFALAVPAGGLLVRLFVIQHDCGHGSFFPSSRANTWTGRVLSIFTVTPFDSWKRAHALHHASNGDLGRRGTGDILTLTRREYLARSKLKRLAYRLYRNPVGLILIGSPLNFLILQRLPFAVGLPWRTALRDVLTLDAMLVGLIALLCVTTGGVWPTLLVVLPHIIVASWLGGWLFFVQHQYEDVTWMTGDTWSLQKAALEGSSHYVLPPLLQWFSGNVGLHHIHHLNSRIPNYRLKECMEAHHDLPQIGRMTIRESLQCLRLALWDEERKLMIGFADLRRST